MNSFAANIQRAILSSLEQQKGPMPSRPNRETGTNDGESDTGKSKTSVEEHAGQKPIGRVTETSREERSSGSVSWGELEKAWTLDPATGQKNKELEHFRANHCKERKTQEKAGERRSSFPNMAFCRN